MAAEVQSAACSAQVIPSRRKESISELFIPKDTRDQPCDVVLMVKDGKEFKAHRRVLSEASPFFQKLLNSDMKESKEGVVQLEMFTESVMATTLQFIYTGHVQILAEDNARDLIVVADYLFLEKLKLLAGGVLVQTLNTSNCISTYYFAERYQCEDLLSNTKKFVLAHFTSIYAANREDVLNMSSREVEMWISSDEIDVSAEEDVFKIILAWIDHDRSRRKRYFAKLFRHVRLVYVSPDFLRDDIMANELVKGDKNCLVLVKDALNLVDSKNCDSLCVPPRKSLETPVVVINGGENILCYFPRENSWCKLGEIPAVFAIRGQFVPCDGQLYSTKQVASRYRPQSLNHVTYNPYSNSWTRLPSSEDAGRLLRKIFVRNGDEMYALMSEPCAMDHLSNCSTSNIETHQKCGSLKHTSFLTRYKPKSNSWEDVSSFDHLDLREDFCIVANENFIFFIGGKEWCGNAWRILTNVDRYDLSKNQWDKVADIQIARKCAQGAAANEKIYIFGGVSPSPFPCPWTPDTFQCYQCEVYDETTNEWQFITSIRDGLQHIANILAVGGELYALGSTVKFGNRSESDLTCVRIERYDPEENKWKMKTKLRARRKNGSWLTPAIICSMRLFKGLFNIRQMVEAFPTNSLL